MSRTTAPPVTSRARHLLLVVAVVVALTAIGFALSRVLVSGWPTNPFVADLGRPGDRPYATGFVLAALVAMLFYVFRRAWARRVVSNFARAGLTLPGGMTLDRVTRVAPIGSGAMYLASAILFFYYFI